MIPHVVLCLAYQRERMAYQNSSSNPYNIIVLQWYSNTSSEMTTLVISLMVSCYTIARQYRGLMTNSGTPFFLVGTQDIRPHEVS